MWIKLWNWASVAIAQQRILFFHSVALSTPLSQCPMPIWARPQTASITQMQKRRCHMTTRGLKLSNSSLYSFKTCVALFGEYFRNFWLCSFVFCLCCKFWHKTVLISGLLILDSCDTSAVYTNIQLRSHVSLNVCLCRVHLETARLLQRCSRELKTCEHLSFWRRGMIHTLNWV